MGKIFNAKETKQFNAFVKMMKKNGFQYMSSLLDEDEKCDTLIISKKKIFSGNLDNWKDKKTPTFIYDPSELS
jgi:hypothetical protein